MPTFRDTDLLSQHKDLLNDVNDGTFGTLTKQKVNSLSPVPLTGTSPLTTNSYFQISDEEELEQGYL